MTDVTAREVDWFYHPNEQTVDASPRVSRGYTAWGERHVVQEFLTAASVAIRVTPQPALAEALLPFGKRGIDPLCFAARFVLAEEAKDTEQKDKGLLFLRISLNPMINEDDIVLDIEVGALRLNHDGFYEVGLPKEEALKMVSACFDSTRDDLSEFTVQAIKPQEVARFPSLERLETQGGPWKALATPAGLVIGEGFDNLLTEDAYAAGAEVPSWVSTASWRS